MANADSIRVTEPGVSVVTDLGRTRGPRCGLPVNGALDQYSARVANVLVGNNEAMPLIELTALDFSFVAEADLLLAVTGAVVVLSVDGLEKQPWEPLSVRRGETVRIHSMSAGLRAYVAVHGSFDVPFLLGSCAPDSVVGFGIRLGAGDELGVLRPIAPITNPYFDAALYDLHARIPHLSEIATIDVTDGPDLADFAGTAGRLYAAPYEVGANSNHIGLRLSGSLPERRSTTELLSRGVPVGAVEVPPGDELLVLHRGRGVTAGYPVLAVVTSVSLNTLAQVSPGQRVVFRRVEREHAIHLIRAERDDIARLQQRVDTVFAALGATGLAHRTSTKGNARAIL